MEEANSFEAARLTDDDRKLQEIRALDMDIRSRANRRDQQMFLVRSEFWPTSHLQVASPLGGYPRQGTSSNWPNDFCHDVIDRPLDEVLPEVAAVFPPVACVNHPFAPTPASVVQPADEPSPASPITVCDEKETTALLGREPVLLPDVVDVDDSEQPASPAGREAFS